MCFFGCVLRQRLQGCTMPTKGKYLLNNQELKQEALYRKFSCISQYQLLVLLLGLSMLSCAILIILFFSLRLVSTPPHPEPSSQHQARELVLSWSRHISRVCGKGQGDLQQLVKEYP